MFETDLFGKGLVPSVIDVESSLIYSVLEKQANKGFKVIYQPDWVA